jgi:uncharacterized protein
MSEFWIIVIAAIGSFFAGFVDAVVGGGGLVQVPLLFILFPSINHTAIIATNRLASIAGTIVAAIAYLKKIKVRTTAILFAGAFTAIASFSGTYIMRLVSVEVFKPIILLLIIVLAIYTFFKKEIGQTEQLRYKTSKLYIAFSLIGLVLGLYNGVIGPGTGTLLVFSLVNFIGFNFLHASAHAKVINAIADGASLVAFIFQNVIMYKIALPMMVTNMLGSYVGSSMALQKGNSFVRVFFIIILTILILRFGWDVFGK